MIGRSRGRGQASVLSNSDVSADSASGLGPGLLFQNPFFFHTTVLLLFWALLATRDLRGLKNARGGWEKWVGDTPLCQRQMGT